MHPTTVRLWQLHTGTGAVRYKHSTDVLRVVFSADGQFIFSGGRNDRDATISHVPTATHSDSLAGDLKAKVVTLNYYSMDELTRTHSRLVLRGVNKGAYLHHAIMLYIDC